METLFDVGSVPAVNARPLSGSHGTSAYGAVAEQLAIAELLLRGHRVAVPVVDDDGVDLVVDYRVRVQVKNAHRRDVETVPGYSYPASSWGSKRGWRDADVFMLHSAGRWWIVPAWELVGHGKTLLVYADSLRGRSASIGQYEDAWHVLAEVFAELDGA